jgi:uncharacterized protein (TIGR03086 family)
MFGGMVTSAERFRAVAGGFTTTVAAVPRDAWQNPSPCPDWAAVDVVRHLVGWIPGPGFLLGTFGIDTAPVPSVDDDPLGAWVAVRDAVQAGLDDPTVASRIEDCGPIGSLPFSAAVDMTVSSDVFIHTWDLATAAGVPAALDEAELARQLDAVASIPPEVDAAMRASGHFGPRIEVGPDADPLTRVLAFYGRQAPATP